MKPLELSPHAEQRELSYISIPGGSVCDGRIENGGVSDQKAMDS